MKSKYLKYKLTKGAQYSAWLLAYFTADMVFRNATWNEKSQAICSIILAIYCTDAIYHVELSCQCQADDLVFFF